VGRDLAGREDLHVLVPDQALDPMWSLHHDHAAFMDTIFCLGSCSLLVGTMGWFYRVGSARGVAPDFFPVQWSAWQAAIRRRLPSPLAEPILAIYDWIIQQHATFMARAQPQAWRRQDPWAGAAGLEPLLEELLAGDFLAADLQIKAMLGEHPDLEELYLGVLAPIMEEVGLRWELGRISEAQEHLASALVMRLMTVSYAQASLAPRPGKRALVCCGPHELHQIGAWMVADFLELDGWDARLLGADTTIPGLLDLIREFRPRLLALSIAMPFHLAQSRRMIERVRQHPAAAGLRIMVGGQAFLRVPELVQAMGADGTAADARGAARLARTWWGEAGLER
jgi:methanogenic corrinoid protein MtbC1